MEHPVFQLGPCDEHHHLHGEGDERPGRSEQQDHTQEAAGRAQIAGVSHDCVRAACHDAVTPLRLDTHDAGEEAVRDERLRAEGGPQYVQADARPLPRRAEGGLPAETAGKAGGEGYQRRKNEGWQ